MTAGPARRTFAPGGAWGAGLNPHTVLEADPRRYALITSVACPDTRSIWPPKALTSHDSSKIWRGRSEGSRTKSGTCQPFFDAPTSPPQPLLQAPPTEGSTPPSLVSNVLLTRTHIIAIFGVTPLTQMPHDLETEVLGSMHLFLQPHSRKTAHIDNDSSGTRQGWTAARKGKA